MTCSLRFLPFLLCAISRAFVFGLAELDVADARGFASPLHPLPSLAHWHHHSNRSYNPLPANGTTSIRHPRFKSKPKSQDPLESKSRKKSRQKYRPRRSSWPLRNPPETRCANSKPHSPFTRHDLDLINAALNVQYLSTEFFLHSAYGRGLDYFDSKLSGKGPAPIGGAKAKLSSKLAYDAVKEIGLEGIGHIRITRRKLNNSAAVISRPQIDISKGVWASLFANALETKLDPPFNPYNDTVSFLLAAYLLPCVAFSGYVGQSPHLVGRGAKKLVAGLLSVTSGQDAVLRTLVYRHRGKTLLPYNLTVEHITAKLSAYRNKLVGIKTSATALCETMQENELGHHILSVNRNSLPYKLSVKQVFRLLYGSGNASVPGGFFPMGALGNIAHRFLVNPAHRGQ